MATLGDYGFEGASGASDNWTSSQGVIDTSQFVEGAQSIYFDCTGTAKQNQLNPLSTRIVTGRFYYRIKTVTSGTASIIQSDCGANSAIMSARVGQKLRVAFVGGTAGTDSGVLNLDQWYLIDFKFDTSANPYTAVWKIDGADQPTASRAVAAADMTNFRLGNTGTNTYQMYFDALKLTNQSGDYPLGALPVVGDGFPYVGGGYYPA